MDIEILKLACSTGVGSLLGVMMFLIYRSEKKHTEDRLTKLLEEDQETRREHTKAITELIVWLKTKNVS